MVNCQRVFCFNQMPEKCTWCHNIPVIDSIEAVPVNFLSKTVRTRTGRQITLSYRALSSYWGTKSYFFLQKPLKTRINSKYQSKGSTYILHLLAFVEIRLFNVFFWESKAVFRKLMKNMGDTGFTRKRGGNEGSGPPPPLPDPVYICSVENHQTTKKSLLTIVILNLYLIFNLRRV